MFDAERFKERLKANGLTQTALARRTGVSQQSISRLMKGERYGSRYLHRIAFELGTTAAYLMGETDDPLAEAAEQPDVTFEERQLLIALGELPNSSKRAVETLVRNMSATQVKGELAWQLPDQVTLTAMFEGILGHIDQALPRDEQARLLAEMLPIALPRTVGARPDLAYQDEREDRNSRAKPVPAKQR